MEIAEIRFGVVGHEGAALRAKLTNRVEIPELISTRLVNFARSAAPSCSNVELSYDIKLLKESDWIVDAFSCLKIERF